MNLLIYEKTEILSGNRLLLNDRRAEHLIKVLKIMPGKEIKVGQINQGQGLAKVIDVSEKKVELRLPESFFEDEETIFSRLSLILSIPRPQTFKKILEISGTFGVKKIILINSARVERSYLKSPVFDIDKVREHLILGMEQGGRTRIPEFEIIRDERIISSRVQPIHSVLAEVLKNNPISFFVNPGEKKSFVNFVERNSLLKDKEIVIAIGPEGGWLDFEESFFKAINFYPINLGKPILRVETALTYVLAQLAFLAEM